MTDTTPRKCQVRDGQFVVPCWALARAMRSNRGGGFEKRDMVNVKTGQPTRSFVIVHSGEWLKTGIVVNYCPFCGSKIDAPAASKQETADVE